MHGANSFFSKKEYLSLLRNYEKHEIEINFALN